MIFTFLVNNNFVASALSITDIWAQTGKASATGSSYEVVISDDNGNHFETVDVKGALATEDDFFERIILGTQ